MIPARRARRSVAVLFLAATLPVGAAGPTGATPTTTAPGAGPAPAADRLAGELVELLGVQAVAGHEDDLRAEIRRRLPGAELHRDAIGNLSWRRGDEPVRVLVAAPLDEPGLLVSGIRDDGYLRVHRVTDGGGHPLYEQYRYGQPVQVRTRDGLILPGVSATTSTHIAAYDDPDFHRIRGLDDLWIDVGARDADEVRAAGIGLLDSLSLRRRGHALAGNRVAGEHAAWRGATLALLEAARRLGGGPPPGVVVAWVAQAAAGGRGLQPLIHRLDPESVVWLGRATPLPPEADAPRAQLRAAADSRGIVGELGRGPLLAPGSDLLADARRTGLPASTLPPSRLGPGVHRLSRLADLEVAALPVRHAESPAEVVDARDVAALAELVVAHLGVEPATATTEAPPRTAAVPERRDPVGSFRLLAELIETYGVSGHEGAVREAIRGHLPAWAEPRVDAVGNLLVDVGEGEPHLAFVAHMDEVGFEVAEIGADGSLSLRKRGGFLNGLYEAQLALVHTDSGPVPAVIAPRRGYWTATAREPELEHLEAWTGVDDADSARRLGVAPGDPVTPVKRFEPLLGGRGTGRAVDDRVGSTALLQALQRLDPGSLERRVTFAWVTLEEVGLDGSRHLAESLRPDYGFAVDTFVSSDSPVDVDRLADVPLGSGVVARGADGLSISPPETVARVIELARRHGLPVIAGTTGGGTDASAFTAWGGVPMPISWPARYSHSPVELMDRSDLEHLVELILVLAREF